MGSDFRSISQVLIRATMMRASSVLPSWISTSYLLVVSRILKQQIETHGRDEAAPCRWEEGLRGGAARGLANAGTEATADRVPGWSLSRKRSGLRISETSLVLRLAPHNASVHQQRPHHDCTGGVWCNAC